MVTSTPADGMVRVEPPVYMGAPTPILPQGVATRSHVGSGGNAAIKKTSREKQKAQTGVSKKAGVKTTGLVFSITFSRNLFFLVLNPQ